MAGVLTSMGGASGGVPSVSVSPSLTAADSAAQVNVICCSSGAKAKNSFDNRRVVYRNGELSDHEEKKGIGKLFKKFCCCCCSATDQVKSEENQEAINMFEAYLIYKYGPTAAGAAPHYAGVDLTGKKRSNEALRVKEFRALDSAAKEVRENEPQLRRMVRLVKLYDRQQHPESSDLFFSESSSSLPKPPTPTQLSVIHADGTVEKFRSKRMKECLRNLPTSKTIPEEEINTIVSQVKEELEARNSTNASTEEIRGLVAFELKSRGYDILPHSEPVDPPLLESLRRTSSSVLSPEICLRFLNSVKQRKLEARSSSETEDFSSIESL